MFVFCFFLEKAYTSETWSALDNSQKLMSAYVLYKIDFQNNIWVVQIFLDSSWLITFTNSLCVKKTDSYPIHSITQFDQSHHVKSKKRCLKNKTKRKNCTFVF